MTTTTHLQAASSANRRARWLCLLALLLPGLAGATQNNWSGPGSYTEIKTNWWQLGWSNCTGDVTNDACAKTFAKSTLWLAPYATTATHWQGKNSNTAGNWTITQVTTYSGTPYYTIKNNSTGKCLAAGNASWEVSTVSPGQTSSGGYLIDVPCSYASHVNAQWSIEDSSAGSAVGGMVLKTRPDLTNYASACVYQDVWSPGELKVGTTAANQCSSWKSVFYFGGTYTPLPPDHYEIVTPASSQAAGSNTTITIKACMDSSCSSLYSGTPSGIGVATTAGTLGSLSAWSGGSATITLNRATPGSATLSLTGTASPAATNSAQCYNGSSRNTTTACEVNFDGPDHYEIVTPSASVSVGGSTTITIKACADASCSTLYTTRDPSGLSVATTAGTLGSLSAWSGGSATISLSSASATTATLSLTGTASPAASNSTQCYNGSSRNTTTACQVSFAGIDHYEIVTPASNPAAGDTVTLTVKACSDASCSALFTGSSPSGLSVTTTSGTLGSLSAWSGGSATITLNKNVAGTATVGIGGTPSPAATNTMQCYNGSTRNNTTACQITFDTSYAGTYGGLMTNWRRLGDSACGTACAKSAANSRQWVGHGQKWSQPNSTHAYAVSGYPGHTWEVARVGSFYTIQRSGTNECLAVGNSGGDIGYLIFKACNSADDTQQWQIYPSTAGGAVGGVEIKTNGAVAGFGNHCWTEPEFTVGELYVRNTDCSDWHAVFYLTAPPSLPYVQMQHDTTASVCGSGSTVTVRTCTDASCGTAYPYTIGVTAAGSALTIAGDGGSETATVSSTTAGAVTLSASLTAFGATAYGCVDIDGNATDCKINFQNGVMTLALADSGNGYAHKPTTATLTALKHDGTSCTPLLTNQQSISFWGRRLNPASGSVKLAVDGSEVDTVNNADAAPGGTALNVDFGATGVATVALSYDDAGSLSVNASASQTTPALTAAGTLTSQPAGFCITTSAATGCPGGDASAGSCAKFAAAGDGFAMSAQAVAWQSDDDSDYCSGNAATPGYTANNVLLATQLVQPVGGANASLGTGTVNFANGVGAVAAQTVSEVGIFKLAAEDAGAALPLPQSAAASQSANIGRFVPKRLDVSVANVPALANGPDGTWGCTFTYVGQDFRFTTAPELKIRGLNASGDATTNYLFDNFWKLPTALSHDYAHTGATAGSALSASTGAPAVADFGDGASKRYTLDDTLKYVHDGKVNALDAAFGAQLELQVSAAGLTDADGVCYAPGGSCVGFSQDFGASAVSIQLGQAAIRSVHVPVSSGANLPVSLLRWNGTAWENNAADVCTGTLSLDYGNYLGGLQASDLSPMPPTVGTGGGAGTVSLPAPNKPGSVDVTLLGVPGHLTTVRPGDPKATATFSNSAATGREQNNRVFFRREIGRGGN